MRNGGKHAPRGPAETLSELARRGFELSSRAGREIAGGSYGAESLGRDLRDWAEIQRRYGIALASLWRGSPWGSAREPSPANESPETGSPDTGSPDAGLPDTGLPGTGSPKTENPAAAEIQRLGERMADLERLGERMADLERFDERLEELERFAATQVDDARVDQLVDANLRALAAGRRQLETELLVADLHRALLPKAPPTEVERAQMSARLLEAGSDPESRSQGLKAEIRALVEAIRPRPEKKSWMSLRNQLFKGLLGRSWERSRDYKGHYKDRLGAADKLPENLVGVTLSLLESSEYRHRLGARVEAALSREP